MRGNRPCRDAAALTLGLCAGGYLLARRGPGQVGAPGRRLPVPFDAAVCSSVSMRENLGKLCFRMPQHAVTTVFQEPRRIGSRSGATRTTGWRTASD